MAVGALQQLHAQTGGLDLGGEGGGGFKGKVEWKCRMVWYAGGKVPGRIVRTCVRTMALSPALAARCRDSNSAVMSARRDRSCQGGRGQGGGAGDAGMVGQCKSGARGEGARTVEAQRAVRA